MSLYWGVCLKGAEMVVFRANGVVFSPITTFFLFKGFAPLYNTILNRVDCFLLGCLGCVARSEYSVIRTYEWEWDWILFEREIWECYCVHYSLLYSIIMVCNGLEE